jgi:hypothetical protein
MYGPTRQRTPGLLSASAGAAVCSLVAWLVVGLLALPLAVASATGAVLSSGGGLAAISASALLVLLAQPLLAGGLLKVWVTALSDAHLGFGLAAMAMLAALVVDVAAAAVLPASLAFPVFGYSWTGAVTCGLIVSGGLR